jgi:pSer/pThr/pTyr-binding forkhead associated (FHA) protein
MQQNTIIGSQLKVGRQKGNDIELPFPNISGYHADLFCLSENTFIVEDKNSTNGTFVNRLQIKRAVCNRNDEVLFADYTFDLNKYFPLEQIKKEIQQELGIKQPVNADLKQKKDPNDFTREFAELEVVYKAYNDRKLIIQKTQQNKRILQAAPSAILVVTLLALSYGTAAIAAGSIGGLFGVFLSNSASEQEKLVAIEDEFKISYSCPKCKNFFGFVPWIGLANKRTCDRCKAVWVK